MSADAAAVASFWSFGMGMAAFVALEATEKALKMDISSKNKELNDKLKTADEDIAQKINSDVCVVFLEICPPNVPYIIRNNIL